MLQSCQLSPVTDYQGNTSNLSSRLLKQPILFVQHVSYEDIFFEAYETSCISSRPDHGKEP